MFWFSNLTFFCACKKKYYHPSHHLVITAVVASVVSVVHTLLVEPVPEIDTAMHAFEGKLPDLYVYEGQEPVDAVMKWGKLAAKTYHPIVREEAYWELLRKICDESGQFNCTRRRAWEEIDMGQITIFGQKHDITYYNSEVDPTRRGTCVPLSNGNEGDSCLEDAARELCFRLRPTPEGCVSDITSHMAAQLKLHREKRPDSKNTYTKLALEMDAPAQELFEKSSSIVRQRGMNVSPFKRVDNGTAVYGDWDVNTKAAWGAKDAFYKVKDPESREWNDKPCEPLFGGAMCAKTDKDGNMMIEC